MPVGGIYGSSKSGLQAKWGSDLDCQIQRPKVPKTALPSDVRMQLGLKKRLKLLKESSCDNINKSKTQENKLLTNNFIQIKKKPFLRKGSRCGPNTSPMKRKGTLVMHSQLFK